MEPRRFTRLIAASVFAVSALVGLAPAAQASNPVETDPCPPGYYGVQVIVQTPEGSKTVYACVQP